MKKYHSTEIVYDPSNPCVKELQFEVKDWTSIKFGRIQGQEEVPEDMPEPRGKGFVM